MASQPKALAGIGTVALILVAAFFGIDLSSDKEQPSSAATATTSPSTKASAKPGQQTQNKTSAGNECPVATLPRQVDPVIGTILSGGKVKYPENDGVPFGNYEGHLPKQSKNYYREYTVDTPGLNHRGERRIVVGGGTATDPDVWYYTDNHYESFCEIPDAE